jgi:CRISPR/Cas system-associated endonuclease Cas1
VRTATGRAVSLGELLGIEGDAAAIYFRALADLLSPPGQAGTTEAMPFQF